LSALSIFIWYTPNPINADAGLFLGKWIKAPVLAVPQNARYSFMKNDLAPESKTVLNNANRTEVKKDESAEGKEIIYSESYTEAMHHAHYPAMLLSLFVALTGIVFAFVFYYWKKISADKLAGDIQPFYKLSFNKWYFDEIYDATFVAFTMGLSRFLAWFDNTIVDGAVNGAATVTRMVSFFTGKFDNIVVDGLVNFMAYLSGFIGLILRRFQTGRVQTYLVLVVFSLVIILYLFKTF
jgi:NADH-quinone oxidoreductase subunit L